MSKRLRLKKYSRKIVSCNECPMRHAGPTEGVCICEAGKVPMLIGLIEMTGLPAECPLEEYNG